MRYLLVLLIVLFVGFSMSSEPLAVESRDILFDDFPTRHTTIHFQLLNTADKELRAFEPTKKDLIERMNHKVRVLTIQLHKEEKQLLKLRNNVSGLKTDFFWFFDKDTRHQVDKAQLEVNDQERVIENLVDEIVFEWKSLKPVYGIYSKMFLTEAFGFVREIYNLGMNIFTSIVELGLISILLFGSITSIFLSIVGALGFNIFPTIIAFSTLLVNIYWIFKLPFIIIQYSPSFSEFIGAYCGFVGILLIFTFTVFKLLVPVHISVQRITRN
eukprot:TRINITY_DN1112_c0_g1_i1.p1 TRINITY_DN1112_c0_g1~~TRINITY_DN1112_c0_g1_i1.p1  ORF type:complete len:271 (+),score=58.52 TRINITY_DN1112_c0_g1_i1:28-840(+)